MNPTSPKIMLTHLDWTIQRLDEILKREKTAYFQLASLQRFGLTYEMALKCLDASKEHLGSETPLESPIADFEQNTEWLELVDAYNKIHQCLDVTISGNIEPAIANKMKADIYNNLDRYYTTFQKLYNHLAALHTNDS